MKFELGKVMMTVGANTKLECTSVAEILLGRYANGDWGNLSDDDKQENEIALKQNYRLLVFYEDASGVKSCVITEADRRCTTIVVPEDD